ncbi:lipopolysaccharide biosynthesis protein RfbH [Mycobacteroides abscessus subsp. abscessus]|nr:lipopolysaccharide biosynthesis protein RfbH [Mycobacteroides abscessus subsp. abscessus]
MSSSEKQNSEEVLRQKVIDAAVEFYEMKHKKTGDTFKPGDKIPYGGRVFDEREIINLIDSSLDFWLTAGRYSAQFEKSFAKYLGVKFCALTNSGSSANLLALMSLTSPQLGDRRLRKGDEVITVAASFPTTVTPIIHYGAVPVFIDVELPSYNIDIDLLEQALSDKTKAIMVAHTLGNPFNLQKVKEFCVENNLWLIEDNCDALGAEYFYNGEWKKTGTIGDIGTSSFYPAHHISMGEGGAVYTNNPRLKRIIESFRDWGRDCWCLPGKDNTCKQRFCQQLGELPYGYDHKYIYSHFGYNLKVTDMQAAIGCAQIEKIDEIVHSRRANWDRLRKGLDGLDNYFILPEPMEDSKPSWFGFLLTVKEESGLTREKIVSHLEMNGIQTRMLFAGNLLKHPCFDEMRESGEGFRVVGTLNNSDLITTNTFWLGVYPGLTSNMVDFMIEKIHEVVTQ